MYPNKTKLNHVNWKKVGLIAIRVVLSLSLGGILFLLSGLLFVGMPQAPAKETPANALITLGFFLICGLVIYGFAGRWRNK